MFLKTVRNWCLVGIKIHTSVHYNIVHKKVGKVDKVAIALDGEEEITQIMNLEPDIVLTDMKMPNRTGLEVIETMQYHQCVNQNLF